LSNLNEKKDAYDTFSKTFATVSTEYCSFSPIKKGPLSSFPYNLSPTVHAQIPPQFIIKDK
jgi:hypothetical protein